MRIVVTGREGQIVRSLMERGAEFGHEIVPVGRPELDLAGDFGAISEVLTRVRPEAIINAAAYTAVDRAESDRDLAFAVNERGAGAVARSAGELGVPLIQLSTDYVFDGSKADPYIETDLTGPTGVYGASKLAGEQAVLSATDNAAILRTAWVYSPFGANFVKTMLHLAGERDEIAVVADQHGNPTNALDIADGVLRVAANLTASSNVRQRGLFHMTAAGEANWADFADAIFAASTKAGGPSARVRRINSAEYPTSARRPANSRLDSSKLAEAHGVRLPQWEASLPRVVQRLLSETTQTRVSHE
jgi:dTDP-4-dehydrorhamnose reductase